MTKNIRFILAFSILTALLAGCAQSTQTNPTSSTETAGLSSNLSLKMKTGLGILALDGADLEVDAEQAQELLPLWQALQTLSSDSNTSVDEIASLNDQIQESLTADQLDAIDDMSWDEQELSSLVEKYSTGASQVLSSDSGAQTASAGGSPDMGGMAMGGGAPMEGGAGMSVTGGSGSSTEVSSSHSTLPDQADRESAGGMNLMVAQAVIRLLQSKIAPA